MRLVFHVVAAIATAVTLVGGGALTALVMVAHAPGSEALVLLLKLLAAAMYLGGIALAVHMWRIRHAGVVGVPLLAIAAPILIVMLGNALINWGFPIFPSP